MRFKFMYVAVYFYSTAAFMPNQQCQSTESNKYNVLQRITVYSELPCDSKNVCQVFSYNLKQRELMCMIFGTQ